MVQFAVNLTTIFTEVPFIERFRKAKQAGFSYVECQFPYEEPIQNVLRKLHNNNLSMVLINLPAGDWKNGDRGLAIDPGRITEFKNAVDKALQYAFALKAPNIHCMAGILSPEQSREEARKVYIENLQYAGRKMGELGLTLLIEPINPYDMPGYFLSDIHDAVNIIKEVNLPNVRLQFDFYHIERIHGKPLELFKKYFRLIGHVQVADYPGRHQPGTGSMNYEQIFSFIDSKGFNRPLGLEYTPAGKSEDSFNWLLNKEGWKTK